MRVVYTRDETTLSKFQVNFLVDAVLMIIVIRVIYNIFIFTFVNGAVYAWINNLEYDSQIYRYPFMISVYGVFMKNCFIEKKNTCVFLLNLPEANIQ